MTSAAPAKVKAVIATRETREDFYFNTATGFSLGMRAIPSMELVLTTENKEGLPAVYNRAIEASRNDPAVLVFMHDDLHLCDFYWADRLRDSMAHFQIVGIVGSTRRNPRQPSWAFDDPDLEVARETWSGAVGHGRGFPAMKMDDFGPSGREVKLLDGLLLAAHSETLIASGLRFDERFDFNFYDLDFCRQAEVKNIKMGTWPVALVHGSVGNYQSESWREGYRKYLEKWGE